MQKEGKWIAIAGRFVHIKGIEFPLKNLIDLFEKDDLYNIFGNQVTIPHFFEEIESDTWSTHYVFKLNYSRRVVGYIRLIVIPHLEVIEIHGGGVNKTFIEKVALTEAWLLMIDKCFKNYQCKRIGTSCMIDNDKAYQFITSSGFSETLRDEQENRISFTLTFDDFVKHRMCNLIRVHE